MAELTTERLAEIRRETECALNIWDGYSWRPSATTVARADNDVLTTPYPVVARFCEQADPPTVLALLDEVERLREIIRHGDREAYDDALESEERAEKYERMVVAARELLLNQTSGHDKPDSYYRDTPLAVAMVDGWGDDDVIALLAALGIMWDGKRATLPTVEEMRGEPIRSTPAPSAIPARLLSGEHVGRTVRIEASGLVIEDVSVIDHDRTRYTKLAPQHSGRTVYVAGRNAGDYIAPDDVVTLVDRSDS